MKKNTFLIIVAIGLLFHIFPMNLWAKQPKIQLSKKTKNSIKKSINRNNKKLQIPTSRAITKKQRPTSKSIHISKKKKSHLITLKCRGRRRYGKYCLGRIIGPKIEIRSIRCPLGGEQFSVRIIRGLKAHKRDSDLRPHLKRFGQKDYIWFCPKSHYATFPEDFFKPFNKAKVKTALAPIHRSFSKNEKIPGWFYYQAAAAVYWAQGKNAKFFGRLFLRATWAAREDKQPKYEQLFRMRAISAMKIALKRKLYRLGKKPTVAYLIAELYRQAAKWRYSALWYGQALNWLKDLEKKTKKSGSGLERVILMGKKYTNKHNSKVFILP